MFIVALVPLLLSLPTALCLAQAPIQPQELVIYRDARTDLCTFAALKNTQTHKRLRSSALIFEEAEFTERGEATSTGRGAWTRLRYTSYNSKLLLQRAGEHCGDNYPIRGAVSQALLVPQHSRDGGQATFTMGSSLGDEIPQIELHPLIQSGPSENRVDLTFFADGYTEQEKDKFLDDAMRLALDVSSNQTFNTVKPLLNFWAAFVPSHESGIGVGGKPKDTPFGLYRDGTELRGVYYSYPDSARLACSSLGDKCDYPILMGNDPLYGGLGGEFTVITPSLANGPLVLRHELGHSIIDVGEEYDGGFAYFGVNAAENLTTPISWAHWLTAEVSAQTPRVEKSVMPLQDYAWTILNTSSPWSTTFQSSGAYAWHIVRFSVSGIPRTSDLRVELDGKDLGWTPRKDIGDDRWHYDVRIDNPLSAGAHNVNFILNNGELAAPQLCNVEILEFGDASEFNRALGAYSIFPTFSIDNQTSYRPTNEDCLMRIVTTPNFCKVCLEGLWLSLLARVELIDSLDVACVDDGLVLDAHLVPLAHLREEAVEAGEAYRVRWYKDGKELKTFENRTQVKVGKEPGIFEVDVHFATEEVRADEENYLSTRVSLEFDGDCARLT